VTNGVLMFSCIHSLQTRSDKLSITNSILCRSRSI